MFRHWYDYATPLLQLLTDLPGEVNTRSQVSERFLERYRDQIPEKQREVIESYGKERWFVWLGWARGNLKEMGFMEASVPGSWRITQAGRDWLAANPGETNVLKRGRGRSERGELLDRPAAAAVPQGITLEMLEQTRQIMPADQFRQIWGGIYEQVMAEERRKAITPASDRFLAEKARPVVKRVQDFLQGRSNESPKSELVCDWIFVCYNLELFREGASLWRYVNKDDVNPWHYERTAKISAACRARVAA